ncbi:RNA pseudouridine synthase [Shewanella sp. 10N.286.52.C2]|uniref:RluA family pseudouridine synthase n=1 Tax=Shewanella sp. 10N.286.52.C2 TaxID=1880838 RepID=UPI000C840DB4|nr:pseudouridine synthase [Shewanella sp. 10N.286.52.C2]PMG29668.1 RNA pseudouridine synthase [Shewanella sp. 10N.286.52.C2]
MSEFIAPPCSEHITILYQDEHLLLINKPSGLLSLSGKNPLNKDSVHYRLVQDFPTATLVHRLDFGTSGIMLVALNKTINGLLTKQFQEKSISKHYSAILFGHVFGEQQQDKEVGYIDAPIAKDVDNFPFMKICHEKGKPSQSQFEVIERLEIESINLQEAIPITKVKFVPITGRTHQLRLHSHYIEHPILGCDLYKNAHSQVLAEEVFGPRLLLHAQQLCFRHPVTDEMIDIVCEAPF